MTKRKALVTGANGFVGSWLVEALNREGFEVTALLRPNAQLKNLETSAYRRIDGDFSTPESLRAAVRGMDFVFHVAGATQAPSREAYLEINAHGTRKLAEAVVAEGATIQRFVYVSSLAAGGPSISETARRETDPDEPISSYGESKLQGEVELRPYFAKFPITIIRPPMIYGPRDQALFRLVRMASRGWMPVLPSLREDRQKFYDLIHVSDLCRGLIQAATASTEKVPSGEVFYLTGDGRQTYESIVQTLADALGRKVIRVPIPRFAVLGATRLSEFYSKRTGLKGVISSDRIQQFLPDYWICSNAKAKTMLGFHPEIPFRSGMTETVRWYLKQGWIS